MPSFALDGYTSPGGLMEPDSTGDLEGIAGRGALDNIPGTAKGAVPPDFTTAARTVYPVYDGVTNLLPGYNAADIANFANWHSAHQAQYLDAQTSKEYEITSGTNTIAYFMLTEDNKPLNVLGLTLGDFATLSLADQGRVSQISTANSLNVLETLGLTVLPSADVDSVLTAVEGKLSASSLTSTDQAVFQAQYTLIRNQLSNSFAVAADKVIDAIREIDARMDRVDAFYSVDQRPPRGNSVSSSYTMGREIGYDGTGSASATFVQNRVSSLDDGATIEKGYNAFMAAERTILTMKERRNAIADSTTFLDPKLDLPNLIFKFQLLYEAEAEGLADSGTEEIRQLHKLLEDYSVMQRLINETTKEFDPGESGELRRFMNIGAKDDGSVDESQASIDPTDLGADFNTFSESYSYGTATSESNVTPIYHWSVLAEDDNTVSTMWRDFKTNLDGYRDGLGIQHHVHEGDVSEKLNTTEMRAFSMFAQASWATTGGRDHPIERLLSSFERPTFDFITQDNDEGIGGTLELHSKTAFDSFQTSLSDAITILNQENQLKQNEIENASKRQNRHFELGNNALRKMNDLLLTIGRF